MEVTTTDAVPGLPAGTGLHQEEVPRREAGWRDAKIMQLYEGTSQIPAPWCRPRRSSRAARPTRRPPRPKTPPREGGGSARIPPKDGQGRRRQAPRGGCLDARGASWRKSVGAPKRSPREARGVRRFRGESANAGRGRGLSDQLEGLAGGRPAETLGNLDPSLFGKRKRLRDPLRPADGPVPGLPLTPPAGLTHVFRADRDAARASS